MKVTTFKELKEIANKNTFAHPIFWLEGDENYFIDAFVNDVEKRWVPDHFKSYDQSIFYGKESAVEQIIYACRRFPMQHPFQLIIIKEAQELKDIGKMLSYFQNPNESTILVVAYKNGKMDLRTKLGQLLTEKCYHFFSKKLYDNELPLWVEQYTTSTKITIEKKAIALLVSHVGNQLSVLSNELDKLLINKASQSMITSTDIEIYIGINKEYNLFDFQDAIGKKDVVRIFTMLEYFKQNAKENPPTKIISNLFYYFQKIIFIHQSSNKDSQSLAKAIGVHPYFLNNYMTASKNYSATACEIIICLISSYHRKDLGIEPFLDDKTEMLKELMLKVVNL